VDEEEASIAAALALLLALLGSNVDEVSAVRFVPAESRDVVPLSRVIVMVLVLVAVVFTSRPSRLPEPEAAAAMDTAAEAFVIRVALESFAWSDLDAVAAAVMVVAVALLAEEEEAPEDFFLEVLTGEEGTTDPVELREEGTRLAAPGINPPAMGSVG